MRAAIIGAVESTRLALHALAAAPGWRTEALVTLPPTLAARHSDFVDLAPEAAGHGVEVIPASNGNAPGTVARLAEIAPDYLFIIGWSQIAGPALCATARQGAIGYHPAPLPRLRGRAVIPWTILLDEKITASTLFRIDEGVDSGPILAQRFFHLAPDETAETLYARHMTALADLLAGLLPELAQGTAGDFAQDERFATWCAKRTAEDGLIEWRQPAAEVWRLVRAVGRPYPGAFTLVGGRQLVLWRAHPWPEGGQERHAARPGQIVARGESGFAVRCGDGRDLWIEEAAWLDDGPPGLPRLHARLGGD